LGFFFAMFLYLTRLLFRPRHYMRERDVTLAAFTWSDCIDPISYAVSIL